jgi:hypothetical protein
METSEYNTYAQENPLQAERPDFLKILCILSFVACGLWILVSSIGTVALTLDEAAIETFWAQAVSANPQLEEVEPVTFIHDFGMLCVYMLIATIFSLTGVIMMWRLEKMGFFIYVAAELVTHFFTLDIGNQESKSYGGMIFGILIDLIFIVMYFMNLKYMGRNRHPEYQKEA